MLGIFGRYVARQTAVAWVGVAGVLILVVVVNRFAVYLGQAATGKIPAGRTFVLLGLSVVGLLDIIIPVSLFLAAVLTLGRLYRDSESTAAWTCGLTPARLYRPFALLAVLAAILLAALALYVSPWSKARVHALEQHAQAIAQVSLLAPGRFKSLAGGTGVFYAGGLATGGGRLTDVFSVLSENGQPVVFTAAGGELRVTPATGERHFLLGDGFRFTGTPGQLGWTVTQFAHANLLIRPPQESAASQSGELDRMPTAELIGRGGTKSQAALDWRIAQPLTVLVLLLIAVPLAHTRPRRGRYARLVPAILIYVVYYNLLGVARIWSADGRLPLWWVPVLAAAGGLVLVWWHYGRHGKSPRWRPSRAH